ncbi:MAG TPA: D-arabinono-1,4-lactone oxidase, partial [Nannocystis sp.]
MSAGKSWTNWSGSVTCHPRQRATPTSLEALSNLVRETASAGGRIRVAGSGHSFAPVVATDQLLVSLARLSGLVEVDRDARAATVLAGTRIRDLGPLLGQHGLALENQGDIDAQAIAGAVSTGTHGTGIAFGCLSTQVRALTLVLASGEQLTCSPTQEPEIFKAAQVSLGALGVLARLRFQCVPSYVLRDVRKNIDFNACLADFEDNCRRHRHYEFWWFPYSDRVATKALDIVDTPRPRGRLTRFFADKILETAVFWAASEAVRRVPSLARPVARFAAQAISEADYADLSYRVFPSARDVRFNEMEYAVPVESGFDCLRELRAFIERDRIRVHFPLEYRVVAADDIWLSPFYQRDSAVISVHMYAGMPYEQYFAGCEAIFRNHRGRPHWGKLHSLTAHELRDMYPEWERFHEIRRRLDPNGV